MEEKMRKMKEKLKNKSAEKKAATKPAAEGSQSSPAAASSGSAASPCSSQTTVTVNDGKSSKAASQKRVEADIFRYLWCLFQRFATSTDAFFYFFMIHTRMYNVTVGSPTLIQYVLFSSPIIYKKKNASR